MDWEYRLLSDKIDVHGPVLLWKKCGQFRSCLPIPRLLQGLNGKCPDAGEFNTIMKNGLGLEDFPQWTDYLSQVEYEEKTGKTLPLLKTYF